MRKRYIDKFSTGESFLITTWAWIIPMFGGNLYCKPMSLYGTESFEEYSEYTRSLTGFCSLHQDAITALTTGVRWDSTYTVFQYSLLILVTSVLIECLINLYGDSKRGIKFISASPGENTLSKLVSIRLLQIPLIMFVLSALGR